MFEKYPLIVSRYEELSEAIVQPDIIADTARYQAYLKERAALEEQVTAWQSYQSLLRHREQAQEMLSDPDLHDMAEEELQALTAQINEQSSNCASCFCRAIRTTTILSSWRFAAARAARNPACSRRS